jgi:uncharacterized protein
MELPEIGGVVSKWARSKPMIKRVHLFGSRVRGDHMPTSDIDIAVELDPSAFSGSDESGGLATWMFEAKAWRQELQALIPLKVQLERYHPEQTPTVNKGIGRSSQVVYEKAT